MARNLYKGSSAKELSSVNALRLTRLEDYLNELRHTGIPVLKDMVYSNSREIERVNGILENKRGTEVTG